MESKVTVEEREIRPAVPAVIEKAVTITIDEDTASRLCGILASERGAPTGIYDVFRQLEDQGFYNKYATNTNYTVVKLKDS